LAATWVVIDTIAVIVFCIKTQINRKGNEREKDNEKEKRKMKGEKEDRKNSEP